MATRKLYALLVGVNTYARPLIPNLKGTHKDVEAIQNYLEETYRETFDLMIHVLKDAAATRGNIIKEFEQHLGKAEKEDVVLFFFAGHGSWAKGNEAFKEFNTINIEKTLLCHDSRTPKKYDLSDKELAVLLNYAGRKEADVIVIIDACHARGFESYSNQPMRLFEGMDRPRKIEHYLYDTTVDATKFYYYKQLLKHKKVKALPNTSYVEFYACNRTEYTEENEDGGWFTQGFINSLKNNPQNQTYFQVYNNLLSEMVDDSINRTPQFEAYNQFDVNRIFIEGEPSNEKSKRFKVSRKDDKVAYKIQFGAQLGFPLDLQENIFFDLYDEKEGTNVIGRGEVEYLGMKDSSIHLSLPSMEYKDSYWAALSKAILTPLEVGFMGEQEDLEGLNEGLQKQDIEQVVLVPYAKSCPFYLEWNETTQCYQLYEQNRTAFILEFERASIANDALLELFIGTLEHLHQWQNTVDLENPKSGITAEDVVLKFNTSKIANKEAVKCVYAKGQNWITTDLESANAYPQKEYTEILLECEEEETYDYEVGISNTSFTDDYYVAYLLISADYGVIPLESNIHLPARKSIENIIDPNYNSLFIGRDSDHEITNYLKVIVSRQELPTIEGFMLNGLELEQQLEDQIKSRAVIERRKIFDWQTRGLAFRLKRKNMA